MEETIRLKVLNAFLLSILLFSLPEVYSIDVSKGRDYFIGHCIGCHAFACNKEGPSLGGLFGRKAGSAEGYEAYYSDELKNYGVVWDENTLDVWFTDPGKIVVSVMAKSGKIDDVVQRQEVIAFLKTEDPTINLCPQ
jgi:cytochrome c2